jgi:hypothetical protein
MFTDRSNIIDVSLGQGICLFDLFNTSARSSREGTIGDERNVTNLCITPFPDTLTGVVLYTIQVSNDEINWYDYHKKLTNIDYTNGVEIAKVFNFRFIRAKVDPVGATGNISFELSSVE